MFFALIKFNIKKKDLESKIKNKSSNILPETRIIKQEKEKSGTLNKQKTVSLGTNKNYTPPHSELKMSDHSRDFNNLKRIQRNQVYILNN